MRRSIPARNPHTNVATSIQPANNRQSRRGFLKAVLALAGYALMPEMRSSAATIAGPCGDTIAQILDTAATVEALAGAHAPQQVIIERTGFFSVGTVSVGQRIMLPLVRR
jgi:hypothetical protein